MNRRAFCFLIILYSAFQSFAQVDSSQKELHKAIIHFRNANDSVQLAQTYHQLAMLKQFLDEQDSALHYLLLGRAIYLATRDTYQFKLVQTNIGHWYIANGNADEAQRYFTEALDYFIQRNDTILMAHGFANMALAYEKKGQPDSAAYYRNFSLPLAFQIRDSFLVMINLWSLSEDARWSGDYSKASGICDEALKWSRMNDKNRIHLSAITFNKGEILRLLEKPAEALLWFDKALDNMEEKENAELKSTIFLSMSLCYEALDEPGKALAYRKKHQEINEGLLNESRQKSIEQLRIQFETENKEKEISFLQRENDLVKNDAARKRRFYIFLSVALITLVFVSLLALFINRKRLHAQRLIHIQSEKIHHQQITELEQQHRLNSMNELMKMQETERERIARDLHDSLGGLLSAIKMHFKKLRTSFHPDQRDELAEQTSQLINTACESVRTLSHNMMPDAFSKFGLKEALSDLVERTRIPGLEIMLHTAGLSTAVDKEKQTALYRITEEALSNIVRHAAASEVFIQLTSDENFIKLSIEDNGAGFDLNRVPAESHGLKNMKSRTAILQGTITLESAPGKGTLLIVTLPR